MARNGWVAVKELDVTLSYHNFEIMIFGIYIYTSI